MYHPVLDENQSHKRVLIFRFAVFAVDEEPHTVSLRYHDQRRLVKEHQS